MNKEINQNYINVGKIKFTGGYDWHTAALLYFRSLEPSETLKFLRDHSLDLNIIVQKARDLGLNVESPEVIEPMLIDCAEGLSAFAQALGEKFFALNEHIWRREDELSKATDSNRPWRELGDECHGWFELWKHAVSWTMPEARKAVGYQPYHTELLAEAYKRASEGDKIAKKFIAGKWGIMFG